MKHLSECLKINTSIRQLFIPCMLNANITKTEMITYLPDNHSGPDGAKFLSESLKNNTSITKLNLGENNFCSEGAEYISECLKINTSITHLYLDGTRI